MQREAERLGSSIPRLMLHMCHCGVSDRCKSDASARMVCFFSSSMSHVSVFVCQLITALIVSVCSWFFAKRSGLSRNLLRGRK